MPTNRKNKTEFRQDTLTGRWALINTDLARKPKKQMEGALKVNGFKSLKVESYGVPGSKNPLEIHRHLYPPLSVKRKLRINDAKGQNLTGTGDALLLMFKNNIGLENCSPMQQQVFAHVLAQKIKALYEQKKVKSVAIFRNQGWLAGASLAPAHHQLWTLPVQSVQEQIELDWQRKSFGVSRCPSCSLKKQNNLLVQKNSTAFLNVRWAPRFVGELLVLPKRHVSSYTQLNLNEQLDLISLVAAAEKKLKKYFGDAVSFNEIWYERPIKAKRLHFRVEILPRINRPAGLELGAGVFVSYLWPEDLARALKRLK